MPIIKTMTGRDIEELRSDIALEIWRWGIAEKNNETDNRKKAWQNIKALLTGAHEPIRYLSEKVIDRVFFIKLMEESPKAYEKAKAEGKIKYNPDLQY